MRPALQRLLSRPSSLDLLKCFVECPSHLESRPVNSNKRKCRPHLTTRRGHTSSVTVAEDTNQKISIHKDSENPHLASFTSAANKSKKISKWSKPLNPRATITWEYDYRLQTTSQLEHESDVGRKLQSYGSRLVDRPQHRGDYALWMNLLDFRRRRFGDKGVKDIWNGMMIRNVDVPVNGRYSDPLWDAFVQAGLQDINFLVGKLIPYANLLERTQGVSWDLLYVKIMHHLLDQGSFKQIDDIHLQLIKQHPPSADQFAEFFHDVVMKRGNIKALKRIYLNQEHRNVYSMVIADLCGQNDFQLAFEMHQFLTHKGDFPKSATIPQPLIDHLVSHNPPQAVKVRDRLVAGGISFATIPTPKLSSNLKLTREMMNEMHGETLNIKEKKYNDSLGARWFATSWIPLDVTINAVHALGVNAIGPLSLQAISLRDGTTHAISSRIQHLEKIGISIGDSKFSKAVRSFSDEDKQDFLDDLLHSDQHPDALEDWKLQEQLLASYAEAHDWRSYNRTMAILTIDSEFQQLDKANAYLRTLMSMEKLPALVEALEQMRLQNLRVKSGTIVYLLRGLLRRRRQGRRPVFVDDLDNVVSILLGLLKSGNVVPLTAWEEPLRRLGMLGRFDDLEKLCLWLAGHYSPYTSLRILSGPLNHPSVTRSHDQQIQGSTYHPKHPLRIIFSPHLQKAIIEWSFLNAWRKLPKQSTLKGTTNSDPSSALHPSTKGICLLHQLQTYGVYIHGPAVSKAIFNRLVALYGPGISVRRYNRKIREANNLSLGEMMDELDRAWGGMIFGDVANLKQRIMEKGSKNIRKRAQILSKRPVSFRRSGLSRAGLARQFQ